MRVCVVFRARRLWGFLGGAGQDQPPWSKLQSDLQMAAASARPGATQREVWELGSAVACLIRFRKV